eukprot:Gregarina_sp_Poly_1__10481@NODE_766_length_6375_cov_28_411382_g563_i0_p2_GENE_NODE_766_length_6375_cov_28_411382_g563_i0NODE_766_length_6375_cov_28_411382_g563_i0_p2_ORF_typecomplete_len410_score68_59IIGP/PF05049_13/6_7e02IIGP/PF05049_13/2e53MMR_HSR1/PF01926_23/1_5e03MMR_HSR1/PF01926_23/5_7e07RsgA_GTPase/PF03193_16/0_00058RsgA_GTPase/PF03193_16/13FeoB_N/PF02421_18/2_3e05AAA_15/PF13175_6/0_26Dynamin_N/PF00350_23/2e02Dynamin_N/PF00350_23/0_002AIG1/PF04548_16/2_9e03AIG1/PF04548_16/0_0023AIG1/PF0454
MWSWVIFGVLTLVKLVANRNVARTETVLRQVEDEEEKIRKQQEELERLELKEQELINKIQTQRIANLEKNARKLEEFSRERIETEKLEKEVKQRINDLRNSREKIIAEWKGGRMLKIMPTREEFEATKRKYGYRDDRCHIAVTGLSGAGKSSFINAVRGVADQSKSAARVGVTECTDEVKGYRDPNPKVPIMWFDVPGAGTLKCPKAQYFTSQGLWVFDCIIVVWESRFTETDLSILDCCRDWNIPTMVVRSKSDIKVNEIVETSLLQYAEDDYEGISVKLLRMIEMEAIEKYREVTEANVAENLQDCQLPPQRVFLVSREHLCSVRQRELSDDKSDEDIEGFLDENALLEEVLKFVVINRAPDLLTRWKGDFIKGGPLENAWTEMKDFMSRYRSPKLLGQNCQEQLRE